MNKNLIITILIAVVGVGAGFAGGIQFRNYQLSKARGQFTGRFANGMFMGNAMNRGRMFGGGVMGDIISQDDKSITVKMADGSTKIVILADSTMYSKSDNGSKTDLKVGTKVAVFGMSNSDGSVTAQSVQINPPARPSASPAAQ